ncbi:MAG: MBL fold metallo-hydrolase [Pseudomonadales bacterium]
MALSVQSLFDADTHTFSYLLIDTETRVAAVVDPVLGFNPITGVASYRSADQLLRLLAVHRAQLDWVLETHLHADHLSAAHYLRAQTGAAICIGANVRSAQQHFGDLFGAGPAFARDGSQFDRLLTDGEQIQIGASSLTAMDTPGHTAACMTYYTHGAAFIGDTLFMPDYGTARTDFPGGNAATLYQSIGKILALPDATQLYLCHDYGTSTRSNREYRTSVAAQRQENIHWRKADNAAQFAQCRQRRDATLATPRLLYPSVQFNMRAGAPPAAEANGRQYFKLPLRGFQ